MSATYALLGDPVEHSPSPALYAAAFRSLGFEGRYEAQRVSASELPRAMRRLAAAGGGNVTTPHKLLAAGVVDRPSVEVARSGACNCFWGTSGGSLAGDNTDVGGFLSAVRCLTSEAGTSLVGARTLVLGTGGAARAVLVGLREAEAGGAEVLSRRPSRAEAMLDELSLAPLGVRVLRTVGDAAGPYDLVVNATSLGLRPGDRLPIDLSRVETTTAFDCVYGRGGTPWTRHAAALGIRSMDGLEMLVAQAGLSVRNWIGRQPPAGVMREAASAALAGASDHG